MSSAEQPIYDTSRSFWGKDNKKYTICTRTRNATFHVFAFCEGSLLYGLSCTAGDDAKEYDLLTNVVAKYAAVPPQDFI